MKCRTCGTEIAAKALICYRCGTPTTAARVQPRSEPRRRGPWPVILAILALIVTAVFTIPLAPEGWPRIVAFVVLALVTFVAVFTLRPTRQRYGRWRR